MTDLQLIICAAIVAFAISAVFGIGVIFSVCEMLKQLDEETPEDQTPAKRYEFNTIAWPYFPKLHQLKPFEADGWRIVNVVQCADGYMVIFEREKVKEGKK